MEITVHRTGANYGPFSAEEITHLLAIGTLQQTDWAWITGGNAWAPLAQAMGCEPTLPASEVVAQDRTAKVEREAAGIKAREEAKARAADHPLACKQSWWTGRHIAAAAAAVALVGCLLWWGIKEDVADYNTLIPNKKGVHYQPGESEPFTGLAETRYFDGSKMIAVRFRDGREHGSQRSWYKNGNKETEGTRVKGQWDGKLTHWYPNGQKMAEYTYDKGKLLIRRNWDEVGNKLGLQQAAR